MFVKRKIFRITFLLLFLTELFSLYAWSYPVFNNVTFTVIIAVTFIIALIRLDIALYIALAELFIGSLGWMFSFSYGDIEVPVRIGLWVVIMSVWLLNGFRGKLKQYISKWEKIISTKIGKWLIALAVVVLWGFAWGAVRNNFSNVFLDFNNWLYWVYFFPFITTITTKDKLADVWSIFIASLIVIGVKTIITLYFFSHGLNWATEPLYLWIRDTRVGEITYFTSNFYRTFFQNQIWAVIGFFMVLGMWYWNIKTLKQKNIKTKNWFVLLLIFLFTIILISFSRSFWVGTAAGLLAFFLILYTIKVGSNMGRKSAFREEIKNMLKWALGLGIAIIASLIFTYGIITLPPRMKGNFSEALSGRLTKTEEAGSSRVNQLKPLFRAISKHPVIGSGFGTTVTYKTADPRIVAKTPENSGEYTTYAFEWGWLDIVLKIGIIGFAVYLCLIFCLGIRLYKNYSILDTRYSIQKYSLGLLLALIAVTVIHVFTPYLNHPLGIGFLVLIIVYLNTVIEQSSSSEKYIIE